MSTLRRRMGSIAGSVAQWWQNWTRKNSSSELEYYSGEDMQGLARDLSISVAELRELARYGPDQADLLRRRMVALGLDPVALARSDGVVLRDLQRLCTMCRSHSRCARDLASTDPVSEDWQDYCPNAAMLKMLNTLRICADDYK
jgi:Family of unknown function (DUF6455)